MPSRISRVEAVWDISRELGRPLTTDINTANPHFLIRTVDGDGALRHVNFLGYPPEGNPSADGQLADGSRVFFYVTPTGELRELIKALHDTGCFLVKRDRSIWRLLGVDFFEAKEPAIGTIERFVPASDDPLTGARRLLAEGLKDPAALMVGVALETHLRALCQKAGISIDQGGKRKKAEQMNADLAGAGSYSTGVQKAVTAWLDLRNDAAHGLFANFTREQVQALVRDVSSFRQAHPKDAA